MSDDHRGNHDLRKHAFGGGGDGDRESIGRAVIESLIPHAGAMCLLERVVSWDNNRIVLLTATHRATDNPLRYAGRLRALHLCEYGAQAMAIHGGLLARASGSKAEPGVLVSLREVRLHCAFIEALDGELEVAAQRLLAGPGSWQYSFTVHHHATLLAEGRAAVITVRPPQPQK